MNARVHALLPDKQKLLRSRECKKHGCLCSGLPVSIMVKFSLVFLLRRMDACDFLCNLLASCVWSGYGRWGAEILFLVVFVARCVWRFGFELRWNSFNIACGILSSPHRSQTCYPYRNPNPGASKEDWICSDTCEDCLLSRVGLLVC